MTGDTADRGRAAALRKRVDDLRREVHALAVALRDPRTPRRARLVAGLTVGLALSPVDPVPDVVPVIGYLDDLVLVPVGVWLARRLTPDAVLADARERAAESDVDGGSTASRLVAALVVVGYLGLVALAVVALVRHV